ncbi:MAG: hypothetical protein AAFV33_04715 [Chloroflexota bacterium]
MELEKRKVNTSMIPELSVICVSLGVLLLGTWLYEPICCSNTYFWWGIHGGSGLLIAYPVIFRIYGWISSETLQGTIILMAMGWSISLFIPHPNLLVSSMASLPGFALIYSPQWIAMGITGIAILIALTTLLFHVMYPDDQIGHKRTIRTISLVTTFMMMSYVSAIGLNDFLMYLE